MTKYNEQYYLIFPPPGDDQIFIKPSDATAKRKYHYQKLTPGAPLFFEHAYRDEDKNRWPVTNVLVDSSGIIVTETFKDEIQNFPIHGLQVYPAVYVDDEGTYIEDYWYIGFYEELDCLDEKKSVIQEFEFDEEDLEEDDEIYKEVYKYSLNEEILDKIAEENRLMFKMGGCSDKYVFAHKKIVDIFNRHQAQGVRFIKVTEFEEGRQNYP